MKQFVVDASVAVKWFLPEPGSEHALSLLESGIVLHAPDLMFAEIANVLWKRIQNTEITIEHAVKRLSVLSLTNINTYPSKDLMTNALKLAVKHSHPTYDCIYLTLAMKLECPMVTADIKFVNKFSNTQFKNYILSVYKLFDIEI